MWKEANHGCANQLHSYLKEIESQNVCLVSKFCKKGQFSWPKASTIYLHYKYSQIDGIIMIENTQLHIHLSREPDFYSFDNLLKALKNFSLTSIWGQPNHLKPLEKLGFSTQNTHNTYTQMLYLQGQNLPPLSGSKANLVKSCGSHFEKLKPLEELFYFEEVYTEGVHSYDLDLILKVYKKRLSTLPSFHLELNNQALAKAYFHEIGFNYIGLGGVFALPAYRKQGYSSHLIGLMLAYAQSYQKGVWLLVKNNNTKALSLYTKLGFKQTHLFQILYGH